jgi:HAMP domain-containing protein
MIGYLMGSLILAIIGVAVAVTVLRIAAVRARRRKELARRRSEIASQDELAEFIRRVDQVTAADELDHLDSKEKDT